MLLNTNAAAMIAAAGIVMSQEKKILLMTRQCGPASPLVNPTPAIAPVTVWVVETGIPDWVAIKREIAAPVSAAQPFMVSSFVI